MSDQPFQRLQLLFAQGVLKLFGAARLQAAVLDEEVLPNCLRVEPYGLSTHTKPGAEVYLAFPNGDRSIGLAIVIGDKRYQMDLAEGEVALHDDLGQFVHIQHGGTIAVKANTRVLADCPLFEATQNAKINGNLEVGGNTMTKGSTQSNAGYAGANGGVAKMTGGLDIDGVLTNNGKNVGSDHAHSGVLPGGATTGSPV